MAGEYVSGDADLPLQLSLEVPTRISALCVTHQESPRITGWRRIHYCVPSCVGWFPKCRQTRGAGSSRVPRQGFTSTTN